MGKKRREISDEEAFEALTNAVIRAVHWAPETLLAHIATGRRAAGCRRLAIRVVGQLAGDGWGEGRRARGSDGLHSAIEEGLGGIENGFLLVLPDVQACSLRGHGRVLDAFGAHFAGEIRHAMKAGGVRIRRLDVFERRKAAA